MRLATDTYRQNEFDGEEIQKTTWHTVVCWDEMAQIAEQHFIKGSHIMVEGMIQYYSYIDKDGLRRHVTEIKAFHLADLDR
jgi:single-strand DNA-binding protein